MAGPILQADGMTVLMICVSTSINVLTCEGRDIAVGSRGRLFC